MPHRKDEEKCFQDEKIEMKDKNGKKISNHGREIASRPDSLPGLMAQASS